MNKKVKSNLMMSSFVPMIVMFFNCRPDVKGRKQCEYKCLKEGYKQFQKVHCKNKRYSNCTSSYRSTNTFTTFAKNKSVNNKHR